MRRIFVLLLTCILTFSVLAQSRFALDSVARYTYGSIKLNDIWGYVDSLGNEYALVGKTNGLSVVNITDTTNLKEVYAEATTFSVWRDIKTWGNYAYVTNETFGGLSIYDLSTLPDSVKSVSQFTGVNYTFQTAHNLFIDENGVAYIFGSNHPTGSYGTVMLDVATTPGQPIELGYFDSLYLHDGYARGDTLYGSAVNDGLLLIIDVSNKQNPTILGSRPTPSNFTHNSWPTDDSRTIITTDEVSGGYVAAYDVTNPSNIRQLDRLRSRNTTHVIPHNAHVLDDFIITSYYTLGVSIMDANKPDNLIEVGYYDTSPNFNNATFNGNWGAYPYLPSGLLILSDMNEGLYVLRPKYKRAAYLEGEVFDCNGNPIPQVKISIEGSSHQERTNLLGKYKSGSPNQGLVKVKFEANGFRERIIDSVLLQRGNVTLLDAVMVEDTVLLDLSFTDSSNSPVKGIFSTISTVDTTFFLKGDSTGQFNGLSFDFQQFSLNAFKWGFHSICDTLLNYNCNVFSQNFQLKEGYQDEFEYHQGWIVSGNDPSGNWVREEPIPTIDGFNLANPSLDHQSDCGTSAFITGNQLGLANASDLDGFTTLSSPPLNLSAYLDPHLYFYSWMYSDILGHLDYLEVSLLDSLNQKTVIDTLYFTNNTNAWELNTYSLKPFMNGHTIQSIQFKAEDVPPNNVVEVGIDFFRIIDGNPVGIESLEREIEDIYLYPNPFEDLLYYDFTKWKHSFDQINVLNAFGQLVFTTKIMDQKGRILLKSDLESGIYFIQLLGEDIVSRKIIKY